MKIYATEKRFLSQLLADRKELFSIARTLKSAAEMREAKDELFRSSDIYAAPKEGEAVDLIVREGVAYIPVVGQLCTKADPCGAFTAEAVTEYGFIQAAIRQAEEDPSVKSMVLQVNSPGGYVDGVDETAQVIGNTKKIIVAEVGSRACSAAYWLASQADWIRAMSPVSEVGSIGVMVEEIDDDGALEKEGYKRRIYTSTDAPDKRPDTKTEEGRAKIVQALDGIHEIFARRVAEGRGVSVETVNSDFGKGGFFTAEKALVAGMIDEVIGSHIVRDKQPGVAGEKAAKPDKKEVTKMTLDQIKAEMPDIVAALRDEGIQEERKRVSDLTAWRGINKEVDRAIEEAVASGKTYSDIASQLAALASKTEASDVGNAPAVPTAAPATASGVETEEDELDEEDREAMKVFGIKEDDYRKVKGVM